MFRVIIKNIEKNLEWSAEFKMLVDAQEWLALQIGKPNRMPEKRTPKLDEFGFAILNDQGEVVSELIPAEYTSEIIDLSIDPNFVTQKVREARRSEYPSEAEVIEALMEEKDGKPEKLAEITAKRLAVKAKYPKNVLPQKD